jgi:hypothetical protein
MHRNTARSIGAFAISAIVFSTITACGNGDTGACTNMQAVIRSFSQQPLTDPQQAVRAYTTAAKKIRDEADKADSGRIKAAAKRVATAFDQLASEAGKSAKGNIANTAPLTSAAAELRGSCTT